MCVFLQAIKECDKVNYNLDCDGICSYLLLKKAFPTLEFGGFTNSDKMILSRNGKDWREFSTLFIDIFLKNDDLWSLDQHIYLNKGENDAYSRKINPHGVIEQRNACDKSYYSKYPFSTTHFILSLLEREGLYDYDIPFDVKIERMSGETEITFGDVFLNLDGVLSNYLKYERNVREWASKLIEYSKNGKNIVQMFEYLFSKPPKHFIEKDTAIRKFYMAYGLDDDGGFSASNSIEDNIRLIENLKRSFNKYIGADIDAKCVKLHEYLGDRRVIQINEDAKPIDCDTFAYVGKEKLSYTKEIVPTNREFNFSLFI